MPIYEYRCERCEQLSEFFLRVSDPHPETCPRCGERDSLKKQISQTSFSLKGEGWYVTDYKKDKAPRDGEGKGAAEAVSSAGGAAAPAAAVPSSAAAGGGESASSSAATPAAPAAAPAAAAKKD